MAKKKSIVLTFGRFNPPTAGHHLLAQKVMELAAQAGAEHRIYGSRSHDPKKNPLDPKTKAGHMATVLGTPHVHVSDDIISPFHALKHVSDQGYHDVTVVTGSDRESIFDKVPHYQKKGDFKFKNFKVVTAGGERGEKAKGLAGMSATKQRAAASSGDFEAFRAGLPAHVGKAQARKLFRDVRKGMNLKEDYVSPSSFSYDEILEFAENENLLTETVSAQGRMRLARSARRTAKRRAFLRKLRKRRRRNVKQLKKRASSQVRRTLRKRLFKGNWKKLSYAQRSKIDGAIDKRRPMLNRMVKQILPKVVSGETKRLSKLNRQSSLKESPLMHFFNLLVEEKSQQEKRRNQNARKRKQRANDNATMQSNPFAGQVLIVQDENGDKMLIRKTSLQANHTILVAPDKMTSGAAQDILQDEDFVNTPTSIELFGKVEGADSGKEKRDKKAEAQESERDQAVQTMSAPPKPPPTISKGGKSMYPDSDHNSTDMEYGVAIMFNQAMGIDLATQVKNGLVTPAQAQKIGESQTLSRAGQRIVAQIKQILPEGNWFALHTGGKKNNKITKEWADWGGTDNTPKTDLIFQERDTGEMIKMSVKTGEAQLMSGKASETAGTFYSGLQFAVKQGKLKKETKKKVEKLIEKMKNQLAINERTKKGPVSLYQVDGEWEGKDKQVIKIDKLHESLTKEIEDLFEQDEDFATGVVWEALTGTFKFGENSPATANYVLSMNKDGTNAALTPVSWNYAKKIAKAMKIGVKFKSSAVETKDLRKRIEEFRKKKGTKKLEPTEDFRPYNFWSAFRIFLPSMQKIAELFKHNSLLKQLTEAKIKEIPEPQSEMDSRIYLDEAMDYIGDDPYKLLEFMGIDIDTISLPNIDLTEFGELKSAIYNTVVVNGKEIDIPIQKDIDYDNLDQMENGLDQDDSSNYKKKDLIGFANQLQQSQQLSEFYISFAKNFISEKRNYRKEYDNYQGTKEQKRNRAKRNKVNRLMKRLGRIRKGDGRDVDHKDGNPKNNSMKNLRVVSKSHNRSKK
jgi:hypothetical protein